MAEAKDIMKVVIMVLNIIVGAFAIFVGVNNVFHFFDWGINAGIQDSINFVFYGICVIILGLILIFVEVNVMKEKIVKELGLLTHYLGKGTYVFFIALLSWGSGGWYWGGDSVKYGATLGLVSAILCYSMHFCLKIENCE